METKIAADMIEKGFDPFNKEHVRAFQERDTAMASMLDEIPARPDEPVFHLPPEIKMTTPVKLWPDPPPGVTVELLPMPSQITHWEKPIKKTVFTLNIDNYEPAITELTFPMLRHFAKKIGADFHIINERKFPEWPVVYEKLQIYQLGREMGNDWNLYVDADALVNPEMFDPTDHLSKDTIMQNGRDMAGVRWKYDQYFRRDGRHWGCCFPAGTVIPGSGLIEGLSKGDTVISKGGRNQEITALFSRSYTGEMVRIKTACFPSIEVTANHEVMVCLMSQKYHRSPHPISGAKAWNELIPSSPRWVNADSLTLDHWVMVPRIREVRPAQITFCTEGGRTKNSEIITSAVDERIGWLLGLYVAEGHIAEGRKLKLTLDLKEESIAARAISAFEQIGVRARINRPASKVAHNAMEVSVSSKCLAAKFAEMCGQGAHYKRIPRIIMESDTAVIRAFLEGLVAGDGCLAGKGAGRVYRVVTTSRQLAFEIVTLLFKIGINAHAGNPRKNSPHIQGRAVNSHEVYEINWAKRVWDNERSSQNRLPFGHARFIGDYVYLPVRSLQKRPVSDMPVFNFETEDHTYSAPFVVHNCNWLAVASDWCLDLWHPLEDLTPEQAFANISITTQEHNSGCCKREHLIDDYTLSRNVARYGLKTKTLERLCGELGWKMPKTATFQNSKGEVIPAPWGEKDANPFMHHLYSMPTARKLESMLNVLTLPQDRGGWALMGREWAVDFKKRHNLNFTLEVEKQVPGQV